MQLSAHVVVDLALAAGKKLFCSEFTPRLSQAPEMSWMSELQSRRYPSLRCLSYLRRLGRLLEFFSLVPSPLPQMTQLSQMPTLLCSTFSNPSAFLVLDILDASVASVVCTTQAFNS